MSPVPGSPADINLPTRLPSWDSFLPKPHTRACASENKGPLLELCSTCYLGTEGTGFQRAGWVPSSQSYRPGAEDAPPARLPLPAEGRLANALGWEWGGQWTKTSPLSPLILELTPTLKHFRGQSAGFSPQVTAARGSRTKRSAPVYIDRLVPLLPAAAGARL